MLNRRSLWPSLKRAIGCALDCGLSGVAVMNPAGELIEIEGALERDEVRSLIAAVGKEHPDIRDRLFDNEIVGSVHDGRTAYVTIAAKSVFILAVATAPSPGMHAIVWGLRASIESGLQKRASELAPGRQPPPTSSGGSGAPPAQAFVFLPSSSGNRRAPN